MAFAHSAYLGVINMRDTGYNLVTKTVELRGATVAAAGTALANYVNDLIGVTDAWIESYRLEDVFLTDVLFTAALPHGEASTKAVISAALTTPGKTGTVEIPAPKDTIFQAASGDGFNRVDGGDAAVTTFLNAYEAAGHAFISDGEDMADGGFIRGVRVHRAHRDA